MNFYIKLGKIRGLNLEINKEYGTKPVFKIESCRCETFIDMPYTRIIYTSGRWKPLGRIANDDQKTDETSKSSSGTDKH